VVFLTKTKYQKYMSNDTLASKIELLKEQIQNLQNSGHFTEKEIDSQSYPLRQELEELKRQLTHSDIDAAGLDYGLTPNQMVEGRRIFSEIWKQLDNFINPIFDIEVIDAEILTPNHISA
jgi:hypothetical protein